MLNSHILKQKLAAIDGKDYGACQSLLGTYEFNLFKLIKDKDKDKDKTLLFLKRSI